MIILNNLLLELNYLNGKVFGKLKFMMKNQVDYTQVVKILV